MRSHRSEGEVNFDQLLRQYMAAYELKNLDGIADMLADEVHLQDWNLEARGRAAVVLETRRNFEAAETLEIEIRRVFVSAPHAAAQLRIVVNSGITLDVVDVLSFDEHGKITSIHAYKG